MPFANYTSDSYSQPPLPSGDLMAPPPPRTPSHSDPNSQFPSSSYPQNFVGGGGYGKRKIVLTDSVLFLFLEQQFTRRSYSEGTVLEGAVSGTGISGAGISGVPGYGRYPDANVGMPFRRPAYHPQDGMQAPVRHPEYDQSHISEQHHRGALDEVFALQVHLETGTMRSSAQKEMFDICRSMHAA
jgi:hypothetical protein